MKTLIALAFAVALIGSAFAKDTAPQTWNGYLIDQSCASNIQSKKLPADKAEAKVQGHTKECALMEDCVASGYGIWTKGKFVTFDAAGNKQVRALLAQTSKKDHISIAVTGTMKGKSIAVSSVVEK